MNPTQIAQFVVGLVKPHFDIVTDHDINFEQLRVRLHELDHAKLRVRHKVDDASSKSQKIEADVDEWLKRVEGITVEAQKLLEAESRAQMCFYGLCPNFITLYDPSKKALALAQKMVVEVEKGNGFPSIAYTGPLQATPTTSKGFQAFASRTSIVTKILEEFKKENINMIGVFGMAGVGKSTFVKHVANQAKEENLFDKVVEAVLTQNPDVKWIQNKLALSFGLQLDKTQTIDEWQVVLRNYMKDKKKKILIILDDVWEVLDLETLGVEEGYCKVLLTSRSGEILHSGMVTQKNFRLDVLNEEETWSFFERKVGDAVKQPDIREVATQIAERCGGLPILVETIAKTLRGKPIHSWNDALTRLNRSDGKGLLEKAYSGIEWSYNQLAGDKLAGKDMQSLFLIVGMLAVQNFYVDYLLKYTMGLGLNLFEGTDTMEKAYDRLQSLVDKLKESCLLLDSDQSSHVMMHDLARHVARDIAFREKRHFLSFGYENELKEWPNNELLRECAMMSIDRINIPKLPQELECPGLHLLTFDSIEKSLQIPHNFFKKTKQLKVLDLAYLCMPSLPPSIQSLASLQTLCFYKCELRDMAIVGELRNLEILCFAYSKFKQLPTEIGRLTRLRCLDLKRCPELEVIYPDVIKSLTRLEELNMSNSFNKWEIDEASDDISEESNARLSELKHLPNLTTLGINIKDANQLPINFFSEKLNHFRIFIGDVWDWDAEYPISKTLKLKLSRNQWDQGLKTLLKRCEDLSLDAFEGVNNIVYQLDKDGFQRLKKLHVQNNPEISHILHSNMGYSWIQSHAAFPILAELSLCNLVSLENVCSGQLAVESFRQLKIIKVQSCPKLKNLFSLSTILHFLQLEEIEVEDCSNMKEIIVGEKEKKLEIEAIDPIEFHGLHSLSLQGLPELTCFASNPKLHKTSTSSDPQQLFNDMVSFPKLKNLKLSSIRLSKLWDGHRMSRMQNLTKLIVNGCNGLSFLCSSSMAINFEQLKYLEICACRNMVEIISTEERMDNMFPKLETLLLENLANLEKFCISSSKVEFPCLQELFLTDCAKLGSFIVDPMKSKHVGDIAGDYLFDEKVGFPRLEILVITGLEKLRTIWHTQLAPDSFCKFTDIWVHSCPSLIRILVPSILKRSHNLKKLSVHNCDSLETAFHNEGTSGCYDDQSEIFTCRNLLEVLISGCKSLTNVFPASAARVIENLEKLYVTDCDKMEQIIAEEEVGQKKIMPRFVFPRVTFVQLWGLPQLTSFYPGMHTSMWPSLKELSVVGCDKLEILAQDCSSFHRQQHVDRLGISTKQPFFLFEKGSFSDLEGLDLDSTYSSCGSVFPPEFFKIKRLGMYDFSITSADLSFSLQKFHNLGVLELQNGYVEEIFIHEGLTDGKEHGFAQLKSLDIRKMHTLTHICQENSNVESPVLPNLEILIVYECRRLKNIVSSAISFRNLVQLEVLDCHGLVHLITYSVAKSLVQLESISVENCKRMIEIVASGDDKNDIDDAAGIEITFSRLKELKLSNLPKLKGFCSRNYNVIFPFLTTLSATICIKINVSVNGILLNDSKHEGVVLQMTEEDEEEEDDNDDEEDNKEVDDDNNIDDNVRGERVQEGIAE